MEKEMLIGHSKLLTSSSSITGTFEDINGESFYKIANYHQMDPFFMTIVSNSGHWIFISSNGAVTAGRKNPDNALFPYYTVDKIQDSAEITGSKTLLLVHRLSLASADGLQLTQDKLSETRHLSNVLFNVMRGGIFDENYSFSKQDLFQFILGANKTIYSNNSSFLESLDELINYPSLLKDAAAHGDKQLIRSCYEYLPLAFSRRHGDPSRPWNLFSTEMKKEDGGKNLNYQGN